MVVVVVVVVVAAAAVVVILVEVLVMALPGRSQSGFVRCRLFDRVPLQCSDGTQSSLLVKSYLLNHTPLCLPILFSGKINPTLGNVAMVVALNEVLEVVRFPFALATLPYVTKWWERVRPTPKPGQPPGFLVRLTQQGPIFGLYWGFLWCLSGGALFVVSGNIAVAAVIK